MHNNNNNKKKNTDLPSGQSGIGLLSIEVIFPNDYLYQFDIKTRSLPGEFTLFLFEKIPCV